MLKTISILLACLVLATSARAAQLQEVIQRIHAHGYDSPSQVVRELDALPEAAASDAPLQDRRLFQTTIARFAAEANDLPRAEKAFAALSAMAENEGCAPCRVSVLIGRADLALNKRDGTTAARTLDEADTIDVGDAPSEQLALLLIHARLHNAKSEYGQGVAAAVDAMRLAEQMQSPSDRLRAMALLIGMNADLGDLDRAERIGEDARKLATAIGSHYQLGRIRLQQGYAYALAKKPEEQLKALQDALRIAGDDPGNALHAAIALANIADYHLQHEQPREAMAYARRAEAVSRQLADSNSLSIAQANIGLAAKQMGDMGLARDYLQQAITTAESIGASNYVVGMLEELADVQERDGKPAAAIATMKQVLSLTRSISKGDRERATIELQEKYAADVRDREIERLQSAESLRASEQQVRVWQQRVWLAASIALALGAGLLVLLIKRMRRDAHRLAVDNRTLTHQSTRDPLTGAYNRRFAQSLLTRLQESASPRMGVLILDLDLFKQVNDTYGHGVGDAVLVEVAARLQGLVRENDAVVRWGGEEFVVILPDTGMEGIAIMAERVLVAIARAPVQAGELAIPVSVSIGCVQSPLMPGTDWGDALQVADLALYLSKTWGRNRLTAVMSVDPAADIALMCHDLDAAHRAGYVELRTVEGPSITPPAPATPRPAMAES